MSVEMDEVSIETAVPKKRERKAAMEQSGFQCSFCGGFSTKPKQYYSSLTTILSMRFTGLLEANTGETYADGVLDCINAVFGVANIQVRTELDDAGLLQAFEERFRDKINEMGIGSKGKEQCHKCGQYFEDHELTIDIISPYKTEFICEGCV